MEFKVNAMNQVPAGEVLYEDGAPLEYIFMIVKGKVEFTQGGVKLPLGVGSFLGLNCLENGSYIGTCKAIEPVSTYIFRFEGMDSVSKMLAANKDYNGIALYYQNRLITEMYRNYKELLSCAGSMYVDLKEQYNLYMSEAKKSGCPVTLLSQISDLEEYVPVKVPDTEKVQYYLEFSHVPLDTIKTFYTVSAFMTKTHLNEQLKLVNSLLEACSEILGYVEKTFDMLVTSTDSSLYRNEMLLAVEMKKKGADTTTVDKMIADNQDRLNAIGRLLQERTDSKLFINHEELGRFKESYSKGESFDEGAGAADTISSDVAADLASLKDSERQLINYAAYSEAKAEKLLGALDAFINLKDKESQEDDARKLRKVIAEVFYDLYKTIFKRSYKKTGLPKAVELFLNYGYVSEKLLDEGQLIELLSFKQPKQCGECKVYTIREWLGLIYEGEMVPSRNDMGQDYEEVLREMKKNKEIDAERERELMEDGDYKFDYEVKNVFMPANRVVNGQLSVFVPWLHKGSFMGSIGKSFVDRKRVNDTYDDILRVDYSIFHRETLYVDKEAGIEREYEQKKVPPIFILFPTVGLNGCMWQEITGRRRDTTARIFLPQFIYSNLTDVMVKVFGHFRWAMCKTIQGTNWNNIQVRSLTSEYSDYIQFYKKNHNLSDEKKEKLKLQIQRGRNNLREVFTLDYIAWIQSEANGAVRMNKIAREILATYCPFAYEIRKNLIKQPIYEEAFMRGLRERGKKVHEMELRFKGMERKNIVIPEELTYTLEFYRAF